MRYLILSGIVFVALVAPSPTVSAQPVAFEINVFQGFGGSTGAPSRSLLVFYAPEASRWPADIAEQRRELTRVLHLTGVAFLEGRRATIVPGEQQRIDPMRGRVIVSVTPLRISQYAVEYQVSISTGTGADVVNAAASVWTALGTTTVVGAKNIAVPDGWDAPSLPVLVAITPRKELGEPPVWPVGGDVTAPEEVSRVQPRYPAEAKQRGVAGTAVVDIVIDESGRVSSTDIAHHADPVLEEAALEAVRQWRYRPGHYKGKPVPVWYSVTLRFKPVW